MNISSQNIIVNIEEEGLRIDQLLAKRYSTYSRNSLSKLVKSGAIKVNGEIKKSSLIVKEGDSIEINLPEKNMDVPKAQKIDLDILFENDDVIVINKSAGMVVHPGAGNMEGTLVNALLWRYPQIKEAVLDEDSLISKQRPGIVHRLDKNTSGVLIVAKNKGSLLDLMKKFKGRNVKKVYLAICCGWPKNEKGQMITYLGRHPKFRKVMAEIGEEKGKKAISEYKLIESIQHKEDKISLIEFHIETGRMHQIRVQANLAGTPILGDTTYSNKLCGTVSNRLNVKRQMLHAQKLTIQLPGEKSSTVFEAPAPKDFSSLLKE